MKLLCVWTSSLTLSMHTNPYWGQWTRLDITVLFHLRLMQAVFIRSGFICDPESSCPSFSQFVWLLIFKFWLSINLHLCIEIFKFVLKVAKVRVANVEFYIPVLLKSLWRKRNSVGFVHLISYWPLIDVAIRAWWCSQYSPCVCPIFDYAPVSMAPRPFVC